MSISVNPLIIKLRAYQPFSSYLVQTGGHTFAISDNNLRDSSDRLSGTPLHTFYVVYIFLKMWAPCLLTVFYDGSGQGDVEVFDVFHAFVCVGPTNCPKYFICFLYCVVYLLLYFK